MSKEQPLVVDFVSYRKSVPELLDSIGAGEVLSEQARVLIKPNLINTSPPPVTTPVECCEAIIEYIHRCSEAEIIIGEGCGAPDYDTYRHLLPYINVKIAICSRKCICLQLLMTHISSPSQS